MKSETKREMWIRLGEMILLFLLNGLIILTAQSL